MKPRRQEQELATEEITELAPGVLRSQLPVELPGLGHVNCYLLEDERGLAIVDPGLPGTKSFDTLVQRLKSAGYGIENVHSIIVTHSHFDHFGGAERVRLESGAEIITHENFRVLWGGVEADEHIGGAEGKAKDNQDEDEDEADNPFWPSENETTPWGTKRRPPVPDKEMERWKKIGLDERKWFQTPEPTQTLVDSQRVKLARREWMAVHTPGHTFDHLCLYDPEYGLMISGDHVLPTITPHIGGTADATNPMAHFFASLKRMHEFSDVKLALPAHGHPFEDLVGRSDDIVEHHEERLDIIRTSAAELKVGTVVDYMERLFKPRAWGSMAESETFAHLQHLEELGEVVAGDKDGVMTFRPKE